MARVLRRRLFSSTWNQGQISIIDLPRNHLYKGLTIDVAGTATSTAGASANKFENPFSLIRRLRVIRNGSEVLQSLDGGSLARLATFNYGTVPTNTPVTAIASTADAPFSFNLPIDFASLLLQRDSVSLLRAVGTSSLQLEITWGGNIDVNGGALTYTFENAAGTVSTNPSIQVYGIEIMDIGGDYGDKILTLFDTTPAAITSDYPIDLPLGPFYRRIAIKVTSGATLDVAADDALVASISVRSDGVLSHVDRLLWQAAQFHNKMLYGLEAEIAGYAMIDFAEDGAVTGLIDTSGASSFQVLLELAGALPSNPKIRVITETLSPAALAAGG